MTMFPEPFEWELDLATAADRRRIIAKIRQMISPELTFGEARRLAMLDIETFEEDQPT